VEALSVIRAPDLDERAWWPSDPGATTRYHDVSNAHRSELKEAPVRGMKNEGGIRTVHGHEFAGALT
jgi:hypothetical protein